MALPPLSELCVPVASASSRQHLRTASTDDCLAELYCCGTVCVEKSSGCFTDTGDDTAHFQATVQGLSVPHLMCR